MGRPVIHFEIGVSDIEQAAGFYSDLFDWEIKSDGEYGQVITGSTDGINGGLMKRPQGVPPYVTAYIQVDDLEAQLARIEARGGKILVPPTPIEGIGAFAMFTDPDGNTIGLMHEGAAPA